MLEAASQALDPGYGIAGSASLGGAPSALPRGRVEARHQYPIIACKDGHVRLCVLSPRQWQGMFAWLGKPAAFADDSYQALHVRFAALIANPGKPKPAKIAPDDVAVLQYTGGTTGEPKAQNGHAAAFWGGPVRFEAV